MEKHYSIDPGQGEKMDGCPYSIYEDGRDVKDYIIPPKGYEFIGFRFEPLPNNQVYDGKLVAQYEKSSIKERLTTNIWKILIPVIITAVIALIVLLVVSVFKDPKPKPAKPETKQPESEVVATTTDTLKEIADKGTPTVADSTTTPHQEENGVILDLTQQINEQGENQAIEEEKTTVEPDANDPNFQFKQQFWDLIHQGVIQMDPYHELYVNNKGKVEGEEYDYLRFTILKDFPSFKEWYGKLRKIPESERQSIKSVNELVRKLNEIP